MPDIVIDNQQLSAQTGETILQAARRAGIQIPTLCHDDQLHPAGACGICVVDVKGYGLISSCATLIADSMVIETHNAKVVAARKQILESLIADHYGDCVAPCQLACPAGIDVQGYIALIARGAYKEAVQLIKEALPLPAIIGRICPHPCEQACRRNLVDQPVPICSLKRFAADYEMLDGEPFRPALKPASGFKVAIIGSGPAGLSAAYYLVQEGHEIDIFDALPKPGGMLRYGIPDYRLPQDVLDKEISAITDLGVKIRTNQALGRDFTIGSLFKDGYRAIFLAIGAHQSYKLGIEGEELEGVLSGTDFLRSITLGQAVDLGHRVAVIGGGNIAIDAARAALRLGAEEVTIVYRRSRTEMPATEWEVEEAEEEGIGIHFLAAPIKIMGHDGRVSGIECIKMKLGEPDASGRRRPEPISNSEFILPVDSVIAAIGQQPDLPPPEENYDLPAERGRIITEPHILVTDMKGIFAGGDCVTGAATAVEAIAAGRNAALSIDRYLRGEELTRVGEPFNISKGQLSDLTGKDEFVRIEQISRQAMPKLEPNVRRRGFQEIEFGYTEDQARKEAERCLDCGCKAVHDCSLRLLATEYGIPDTTATTERRYPLDESHPMILRDPNKCISCRRCARVCHDVQGVGALSVTYRVGTTEGYGGSLLNTTCESCGQCVTSCPVGALVSRKALHPAYEVKTVCPYCGVGCGIYLGVRGNMIVDVRGDRNSPTNQGNLCVKGRFGYDFVNHRDRLTSPLIKKEGQFVEATWEEALDLIAEQFSQCKGEQFAVLSSAKCTNEDNYVIQKFTRGVMGTNTIDHCARL